MYTQCPNCSTIFSMTEEDLGAHQGLVRCGRCKEVFNASWNLVNGPPGEPQSGIEMVDLTAAPDIVDDVPAAAEDSGMEGMDSDPVAGIIAEQPLDTIELELDLGGEPRLGGGVDAELDRDLSGDLGGVAEDPSLVLDFIEDLSRQTGADPAVSETESDIEIMSFETPDEPGVDAPHYQPGTGVPPPQDERWDELKPDDELQNSGAVTQPDPLFDPLTQTPVDTEKQPTADSAPEDAPPPAGLPAMAAESLPFTKHGVDKAPFTDVVDEEIIIEAPSTLWGFDEVDDSTAEVSGQSSESSADTTSITPAPQTVKRTKRRLTGKRLDQVQLAAAKEGRPLSQQSGAPEPRSITASTTASDVKLVEIPYPRPMRTMLWVLATIALVLGLVWQIKSAYLSELAQVPSFRGPLASFCQYAACTLPPRTDFKSIDLISTSVDPHPIAPGALRVSANLVNRAKFRQPFPPLEITLTDREGAVVGRRTYLPHEYRSASSKRMLPNVLERVDIDLAQPAESAMGYEIQLVVR